MLMSNILRIIFITLISLTGYINALAGDAALSRIIGFSPDGKYFAFEQYGIEDGSGFPYSEIFFIDTQANSWVENPVRIRIKDETASIAKARIQAVAKATPVIKKLGTTLHGFTLVSNPITQFGGDKYLARFGLNPSAPTFNRFKIQLSLQNASNQKCQSFAPDTKIFKLSLNSESNQNITRNYADTNLPSSRNCALDYSISEVHYFEAVNGDVIFMTFINIMSFGFEGQDRRFMVIPFYIKS